MTPNVFECLRIIVIDSKCHLFRRKFTPNINFREGNYSEIHRNLLRKLFFMWKMTPNVTNFNINDSEWFWKTPNVNFSLVEYSENNLNPYKSIPNLIFLYQITLKNIFSLSKLLRMPYIANLITPKTSKIIQIANKKLKISYWC